MTGAVLRAIDLETTGFAPPAEVIEVGICELVERPTGWEVQPPHSWLCQVKAVPPEVRAVHWITHAEAMRAPAPFDQTGLIEDCDHVAAIASHNLAFEEQWLRAEGLLPAICTLKAASRVWPDAPSHKNGVLRCWLEDTGRIAVDDAHAMPPHRAGPDAYVTAHILKALLEAGASVAEMVRWSAEPRVMSKITFGKHRGTKWTDVPADYLAWVMRSDLAEDTKWNAQREINRRKTGVVPA